MFESSREVPRVYSKGWEFCVNIVVRVSIQIEQEKSYWSPSEYFVGVPDIPSS
jgi:hypothetical protein